jgi:chromosome segregation ATPase
LRGIAITPRSGWLSDQPKSNAEQREAERDRIFAADETLQKIADIQSDLRDQLAALEGEIDALEERRDAMKWTVRQVLAETMSDRDIYFSERSVVEDAADHRTESQLFHEQEDPLNPDEELVVAKESVEDDIPF